MEDKRTIGRTERLSTEDKQYLKEMCFKKPDPPHTQKQKQTKSMPNYTNQINLVLAVI